MALGWGGLDPGGRSREDWCANRLALGITLWGGALAGFTVTVYGSDISAFILYVVGC